MKQWYSFYASNSENKVLLEELTEHVDIGSQKLKQLASEIQDEKLKQADSEFVFPVVFAFVPWMHHVLIMQKCKSIEEALFYITGCATGNGTASRTGDLVLQHGSLQDLQYI